MSNTCIVNIKHNAYDIYIGRAGHGQQGYFGNPYARGRVCARCHQTHLTPSSTLACYSEYFHERLRVDPEFVRRIAALEGKVLGCFCRPVAGFAGRVLCHGQIIVGHIEGIPPETVG